MVVAPPPKKPPAKKAKKRTALPLGVEQSTLDGLFTASSDEAPAQPVSEQGERIEQLGFDSLEGISTGDDSAVPPEKPAGREVYRPAPRRRDKAKKHTALPPGMGQATLFTTSGEGQAPETPTTETGPAYGNQGQDKQVDTNSLAELPPGV
jgi:hypothetical protein